MSSTSSLTGYSPFKKTAWVQPALCKHIEIFFAWCGRKTGYQEINSLIKSQMQGVCKRLLICILH